MEARDDNLGRCRFDPQSTDELRLRTSRSELISESRRGKRVWRGVDDESLGGKEKFSGVCGGSMS